MTLDHLNRRCAVAQRMRERRLLDLIIALAGLPLLAVAALVLLVLNPRFNRGPLIYSQRRMGRHGIAFRILKFRSMRPHAQARSFDAPLEEELITPLGRFLRRHRIDELPQLLNILAGDMNLIGPRPDAFEHACAFAALVPGYARRHIVRPGITGLAQVELGYAQGVEATRAKVDADLRYIRQKCRRLDLKILWRTLKLVCRPGSASRGERREAAVSMHPAELTAER